ncbi:YdcF family protein [Paenibacillus sp. SYP-B3998]|uniref:YdcF family protein n=1 Tax=Paenibacillus sp. SYP-B3998 TaxID=2678564 RepID=A0A6G3ZXY8_9BACL|nr:YdcF family protein [Paenibacillus sp. SYP-B3998]NEW06441.1 YdcF family protein [Paenibacillus sp. SYP-B3998]
MKTENNRSQRQLSRLPKSRKRAGKTRRLLVNLRRLVQCLLILFLLFAGWIVFIQWKVQRAPQMALPGQVDVGIVLGASLRKDLPSPGLQERLDLAIKLYNQGKFQRLIVSGGLDHNGSKLTEAEGMRNYLVKKGIPPGSILLEPKATSTYENLLFSKQIMDEQGLVSSIIMTHEFHSSRSLNIAETIGLEQPLVSSTKSDVLFMPYHEARETLAYTKWEWTKLLLKVGL